MLITDKKALIKRIKEAKKIETDFFPIGCVKVIRDKNNEANS